MSQPDDAAQWLELSAQVHAEMQAWHRAHPGANMLEIEQASLKASAKLHARLVQNLAQQSPLAELGDLPADERPRCANCDQLLHSRGKVKRKLHSREGQEVELERDYAVCPNCGEGFFPLR